MSTVHCRLKGGVAVSNVVSISDAATRAKRRGVEDNTGTTVIVKMRRCSRGS